MIFVTVGGQMPFDRLVSAVDAWAGDREVKEIFAQIGDTQFKPKHIEYVSKLNSVEFEQYVDRSSLIVAHAGMGTVLTALTLGKPIVVMPRRGDLMETRNDHQLSTVQILKDQNRVSVAMDEKELIDRLDCTEPIIPAEKIGGFASEELAAAIESFIRCET